MKIISAEIELQIFADEEITEAQEEQIYKSLMDWDSGIIEKFTPILEAAVKAEFYAPDLIYGCSIQDFGDCDYTVGWIDNDDLDDRGCHEIYKVIVLKP